METIHIHEDINVMNEVVKAANSYDEKGKALCFIAGISTTFDDKEPEKAIKYIKKECYKRQK